MDCQENSRKIPSGEPTSNKRFGSASQAVRWACHMKTLAILVQLVFYLSFSNAQADIISDAANALRSIIAEDFTVLTDATGDLNNDGLDDWVGIILTKRVSDTFQRLYVLTQGPKKSLVFSEASPEVGYTDCAGTCGSEVSIKNGSFYVVQFDRGGWGSANTTTQFKLYKNKWCALGRKTYRIDMTTGNESETDTNLLTGEYTSAITPEFTRGNSAGPTKRKSGIEKPALLLLKDFDLGQF